MAISPAEVILRACGCCFPWESGRKPPCLKDKKLLCESCCWDERRIRKQAALERRYVKAMGQGDRENYQRRDRTNEGEDMVMEEKFEMIRKTLEHERFMRERVFKNKPNVLQKKVGEIDKALEALEEIRALISLGGKNDNF